MTAPNNFRAFRAALMDAYNGAIRPVIEQRFRDWAAHEVENAKQYLGETLGEWRKVESFGTDPIHWYKRQASMWVDWTGEDDAPVTLNTEKINDRAEYSADCVIHKIVGKLVEKLMVCADQPVIQVHTISWGSGLRFTLHATIGDKQITVNQSMRENWTAGGTSYMQHPARLSVDGKAISAANYRKLW